MKAQKLLTYIRKCVQEYDLIEENDVIAVGVSGGKDSLALVYGLSRLKAFYPKKFDVIAITVDTGMGCDFSAVEDFCLKMGVPYYIEKTDIGPVIFEARREENPCSLCSNMRRGALVNAAVSRHANKVALGHHKDDFLNTAMLSLFYEGRFYAFAPRTDYEDREVQIIRPLLYVPEAAVRNFAEENGFPIVKNPCPADHNTKREEMAQLIVKLQQDYPEIKDRLFHAIVTSDIPDWKDLRKEDAD